MSSTKRGNQWCFGMKAHVATDLQGVVEAVEVTAAKAPDHQVLDRLLTGEEAVVLADRGYGYPSVHECLAKQGTQDAVALRRYPGQKTGLAALKCYNRSVARIRALGEHAFRVLKCQFGYRKTRYRGLIKNGAQLTTLFALARETSHPLPLDRDSSSPSPWARCVPTITFCPSSEGRGLGEGVGWVSFIGVRRYER